MNLANKLTVLRIILVPFFTAALLLDFIPHNTAIALGIFVIAGITDALDGDIARTRNLITDFGKFLDPIADKILVMAALVCFAGLGWIQSWIVIVILARDFVVGAIRLAAVEGDKKVVIPARLSGKVKTAVTMLSIIGILVLWLLADYGMFSSTTVFTDGYTLGEVQRLPEVVLVPIANAVMYVCAALTVFSGWQYIWDSREMLKKMTK